jgi:hypothetical protein
MGESSRRKAQDPLYGVVPKTGVMSPLWVVHRGVLFLVGQGDSIACLPAGNMVVPNEEQLKVLEDILSSNPSLMLAAVSSTLPDSTPGTIDMTNASVPAQVTTINLL